MQGPVFIALMLASATSALAQEPAGCDKFKFPIEREKTALSSTSTTILSSGSELTIPISATLNMRPVADAGLPSPPERSPKPGTFAGFFTVAIVPASGVYSVGLSSGAWLDVIQSGTFLKPKSFSGVTGCDGIRKVVKFDFAAGSIIIQVSGADANSISVVVLQSSE